VQREVVVRIDVVQVVVVVELGRDGGG